MKGKWGVIVVIIVIIVSVVAGLFFFRKSEENLKAEENRMKEAAESYFDKYMSSNESTQVYEVTLGMLEEANDNGEEYDLTGLEDCSKTDTVAEITINYQNGKPKKTEVTLKC